MGQHQYLHLHASQSKVHSNGDGMAIWNRARDSGAKPTLIRTSVIFLNWVQRFRLSDQTGSFKLVIVWKRCGGELLRVQLQSLDPLSYVYQ